MKFIIANYKISLQLYIKPDFPLPQFIFNWSIATRIVISYLVQIGNPMYKTNDGGKPRN